MWVTAPTVDLIFCQNASDLGLRVCNAPPRTTRKRHNSKQATVKSCYNNTAWFCESLIVNQWVNLQEKKLLVMKTMQEQDQKRDTPCSWTLAAPSSFHIQWDRKRFFGISPNSAKHVIVPTNSFGLDVSLFINSTIIQHAFSFPSSEKEKEA